MPKTCSHCKTENVELQWMLKGNTWVCVGCYADRTKEQTKLRNKKW